MIELTHYPPKRAFHPWIRPLVLLIALVVFGGTILHADEPQYLRRSIRALGMGDAFVAVANDENALFYNPAGLQSLQQHIVEILTINATLNQNFTDFSKEDSSDQSAVIGRMVGKKFYADLNLSALSISGPGWGYSLFSGFRFDAKIRNPTVPYFELLSYLQYGAIGGMAFNFLDETLLVGASYKVINRNGVRKDLHVVDFLDDNFSDQLEDDFSTKIASSPDIGVIYILEKYYNCEPRLALVVKNIGDMDFGNTGKVPMSVDVGVSTESEFAGFNMILAMDWVDLTAATTQYRSFKRNLKMGVEIGMWKRSNTHHALSFRAGRNGEYGTWGLSVNIPYFPMKIDYANWSEEVGNVAGDIEDKRQSIQISFNF
ncbi:MAG: hypothetical protein ABIK68_00990 [bacterium]